MRWHPTATACQPTHSKKKEGDLQLVLGGRGHVIHRLWCLLRQPSERRFDTFLRKLFLEAVSTASPDVLCAGVLRLGQLRHRLLEGEHRAALKEHIQDARQSL